MLGRQVNSTAHPIVFLMVLASDKTSPVLGASPSVTISKNGGAFAAAAGATSEVGNGWYALAGHATDRNTVGELIIHATAATADDVDFSVPIVGWNPFDASMGIENLPEVLSYEDIADAILKRDWTDVTGEASRSVLNALRAIRNGFSISGATLTVPKEDDVTPAYTRTIVTDPNAEPIVEVS